jgi:hypothetical protein
MSIIVHPVSCVPIVTTAKGNNQKKTDKARPRNTINGNKDEQTKQCHWTNW